MGTQDQQGHKVFRADLELLVLRDRSDLLVEMVRVELQVILDPQDVMVEPDRRELPVLQAILEPLDPAELMADKVLQAYPDLVVRLDLLVLPGHREGLELPAVMGQMAGLVKEEILDLQVLLDALVCYILYGRAIIRTFLYSSFP